MEKLPVLTDVGVTRMRVLFFLIALISIKFLPADIIEVMRFEEIERYLEPDTLIILDIDNTLLEPIQELGTDQWFVHRRDWYEQQGYTSGESLEMALAEWEAVQNITKVMAVERSTPGIVTQLQQKYIVMGMSTRGLALATRTVYQLKDIGINLASASLTAEDVPLLNPQAILFRKGILFTSGTHKGRALLKLFEQLHYTAKRIIFVNDKATHLREVEVACEESHIPFIGLRYGFLDEKVKAFRSDIARVQFENFKMILSDKEALNLIEH
ncbi:MAG: DUF2608 domain-containing protein [Verrucomicrobia bacterium]|nr:DUF2608 domain-containing protein [Verrucomicrobiota bacterium]MBS0647484.1 DUF2608 domain-containing protein [Verrucomicrobiota bacterium]